MSVYSIFDHIQSSCWIMQQSNPQTLILSEYLQFLLLFLTLHLALGQVFSHFLLEQMSTLGFEGVQLGLVGQFCYTAVGAQLELTEPRGWKDGRMDGQANTDI